MLFTSVPAARGRRRARRCRAWPDQAHRAVERRHSESRRARPSAVAALALDPHAGDRAVADRDSRGCDRHAHRSCSIAVIFISASNSLSGAGGRRSLTAATSTSTPKAVGDRLGYRRRRSPVVVDVLLASCSAVLDVAAATLAATSSAIPMAGTSSHSSAQIAERIGETGLQGRRADGRGHDAGHRQHRHRHRNRDQREDRIARADEALYAAKR